LADGSEAAAFSVVGEAASVTAEAVTSEAEAAVTGGQERVRDVWFDVLRAVALVRVVANHLSKWWWLPAVFPSMGIMFALAGTLMAASLDRSGSDPWRVVGRRLRRLLPPLWVMGVVLVPLMIWHGWTMTDTRGAPLRWYTLLLWVFPIADPPGSAWGQDWVGPLWYVRTYVWFMLLSPALLWMLRRWKAWVLVIPIAGLVLITSRLDPIERPSGHLALSLCTYGACWILGLAHHDGRIRALPWRWGAPAGVALMAAGLGWAFSHRHPVFGWDLTMIPLAQALYSTGAALLLLRAHPGFSWLARYRIVAKLVGAVNSRAVTIYLWHSVAIVMGGSLKNARWVSEVLDSLSLTGQPRQFVHLSLCIAVALLGIVAATFVFGWVEDVAARRRPRILPWPRVAEEGQISPAGSDRVASVRFGVNR
jgi:peptidoglycan/LPS O-acetylase OafA/YrhL